MGKFGEFKHTVGIQTGADDADLIFKLSNGVEVDFDSMTFFCVAGDANPTHVEIKLRPKQPKGKLDG